MDSIDHARQAMKAAEENYLDVLNPLPGGGYASDDEIDDREEEMDDARQAYRRACDSWEPADCSGVIGAGGLVYSDADPGF